LREGLISCSFSLVGLPYFLFNVKNYAMLARRGVIVLRSSIWMAYSTVATETFADSPAAIGLVDVTVECQAYRPDGLPFGALLLSSLSSVPEKLAPCRNERSPRWPATFFFLSPLLFTPRVILETPIRSCVLPPREKQTRARRSLYPGRVSHTHLPAEFYAFFFPLLSSGTSSPLLLG